MSAPSSTPGHVFWLFGLSGAGKTTLAVMLANVLRRRGVAVLTLDGDALRSGLCAGLGFSEEDRTENLRRAAEVARLAVDSGLCVVASFITPMQAQRDLVGRIIGEPALTLIHLHAPLAVCQARDVKGLYRGAQTGRVGQMTGITSPFEDPGTAGLRLETATTSPETCLDRLVTCATARLGL